MQEYIKRRTKAKKRRREKFVDFAKLARNKLAQNEHEREKRGGIIDKKPRLLANFISSQSPLLDALGIENAD